MEVPILGFPIGGLLVCLENFEFDIGSLDCKLTCVE